MVRLLFRKWWVILLQGILLVILSIYIFNYPAIVLAGISLWFGLLLLITGGVGIISWLSGDKQEREDREIYRCIKAWELSGKYPADHFADNKKQ